jgi:hypothetical protein
MKSTSPKPGDFTKNKSLQPTPAFVARLEPSNSLCSLKVLADLVEHLNNNLVQTLMHRARLILASLIPALWLVASLNCLNDPVGGFVGEPSCSVLASGGNHQQDSSNWTFSMERSARRWSRRFNAQCEPEKFSTPVAVSPFPSPKPSHPVLFSEGSQLSLRLAQSWQFLWRTALESRAPSSIS